MPPTPSQNSKPYLRWAWGLVFSGAIIFGLERFGLSEFSKPGRSLNLDPNLVSILAIAPVLLVVAGCVIFVVGRMRRL